MYKFSQQNWESLNEKMKVMYFRNMQRGGKYGKNTPENESLYLFSILKFFKGNYFGCQASAMGCFTLLT
jgi:hypothetical protein